MTVHQTLATNYQAIRERILHPKLPEKRTDEGQGDRIKALETQVSDLLGKVGVLELNIADYQAALIRQASVIAGLDGTERGPRENVRQICEEVLRDYPGVTWRDIVGASRMKFLIIPRHKCMYEVYKRRPDLSFPAIGKIFNRDHSCVVHAVQKLKAQENA